MKNLKFLVCVIALSISCSCGGDNIDKPDNNEGGKDTPAEETKGTEFIVKMGGEFAFNWSSSDQIKVCDPTTGATYGTADICSGDGTVTGTFKLKKSISSGTDVCLVYPATKTLGSNSSLYQNQSQGGFGDPIISQYVFAVSNSFPIASTNSVSLNIPFAGVRVRLDSDSVKGYKLASATIRCADAALSGTYTVEKKSLSLKTVEAKSSATVNLSEKPVISGSDSFVTILVFPADLSGKNSTLELSLESVEGNVSEKSFSVDLSRLEAGKVTEVKLSGLSSSEYVYTDVSYYWWRNGKYVVAPSRTIAGMNNLDKLSEAKDRDKWGGAEGVKPTMITSTNPEGYWRTGYYKDKKVFVDPDGNVAFLAGFNFVCPDLNIDNNSVQVQNYYKSKFAALDDWANWCAPKVADLGYNFYSNSPRRISYYNNMPSPGISITKSAQQILRNGNGTRSLSQCETLFLIRTFYWEYKNISGKAFSPKVQSEFTLMFDKDYLSKIKEYAGYGAQLFKDDKGFIGYYIDNELPFVGTTTTYPVAMTLKGFLELTTDESNENWFRCNANAKKWAQDWMQSKYGTQKYSSNMESDFLSAIVDYYYKTTTEAIRSVDSNHLILGSRLHSDAKDKQDIIKACAKYCDVVSINFYAYWDITYYDIFKNYSSWTGDRPVLISEFYTKDSTLKSPDGTLYKNEEGAGWIVDSQKDRGIFYQNNIIHFIEDNQIAGWQWFKWTDDFDTSSSGWVNKGVVVPDYSGLHETCVKYMKEANDNLYQLLKYYHK